MESGAAAHSIAEVAVAIFALVAIVEKVELNVAFALSCGCNNW